MVYVSKPNTLESKEKVNQDILGLVKKNLDLCKDNLLIILVSMVKVGYFRFGELSVKSTIWKDK